MFRIPDCLDPMNRSGSGNSFDATAWSACINHILLKQATTIKYGIWLIVVLVKLVCIVDGQRYSPILAACLTQAKVVSDNASLAYPLETTAHNGGLHKMDAGTNAFQAISLKWTTISQSLHMFSSPLPGITAAISFTVGRLFNVHLSPHSCATVQYLRNWLFNPIELCIYNI